MIEDLAKEIVYDVVSSVRAKINTGFSEADIDYDIEIDDDGVYDRIGESIRIHLIKALDEYFTSKEKQITIRFKPEMKDSEVVEIAEQLNDFLEAVKGDKLLEVKV
jgi:hypothetical protein